MNRIYSCSLFITFIVVLSPALLFAQSEFEAPAGVTIERDLDFLAPGREEKLDLYRPDKNNSGKPMPAVVIIHGGGWGKGDKGREREFVSGTALAEAGYVAISINYELRSGKRWPNNLHDCKNAVRWLRKNAKELDVDESKIGVIGGSAGGHLALMVAYTGDHPKLSSDALYPGVSDQVSACVDMYGIANLMTRKVVLKDGTPTDELKGVNLFRESREEDPEKWKIASPVTHVDKDTPPTLIFHGVKDKVVDRDQSKELYALLQKTGVESKLQMVEGANHAWPLKTSKFDLRPQMIRFFDKHLKQAAGNKNGKKKKAGSKSSKKETEPAPAVSVKQGERPNVLFISVDDLNDWQGALGHPQAKTPNMDRLFNKGVLFTNAHCSQAVCNASRNSVMSGLHPASSGWYGSTKIMRDSYDDVMRDHRMMPRFFREQGYYAMTAGKIYHQGASDFPDLTDKFWDEIAPTQKVKGELLKRGDGYKGKKFYPFPKNGSQMSRLLGKDYEDGNSLCWGVLDREDMPDGKMYDELIASWAVDQLQQKHEKPFFMAVGFVRPHVPFTAPREFFDLYDIDDISIPNVPADEMADIPMMGKAIALGRLKDGDHHAIKKLGDQHWREMVLAYLACVSFVDAQIGKVVDELEKSDYNENTVVVLWSDHGQHLGEKRHWRKQSLWEEATRVPLFFKLPGKSGPRAENAEVVSLLDIYPTLVDLCGLPKSDRLEGESLVNLFSDQDLARSKPVVNSWYYGNLAVRSNRWRYIRYRDGSGELYDHLHDPEEHHNLIDVAELQSVIAEHEKWLPSSPALPAGTTAWKADKLDKLIKGWEEDGVPDWLK